MSRKTAQRLTKVADALEKLAQGIVTALELIARDATWGKARYRRKGRQPHPLVIRETIVHHHTRGFVPTKSK